MLKKIEITKSFLTKNLLLAITILIGVAAGILIGYQIIAKSEVSAISRKVSGVSGVPEKMHLKFGTGDHFPTLKFETPDLTKSEITALLAGKKTAVIFAEPGCPACNDFFELWNQIVTPKLRKGVQEVVMLSANDSNATREFKDFLSDKTICFIEMDAFKQEHNLQISPTVLALDETGIVRHIQYGMRDGIDFEVLKFLTIHDI
ncbi:MAG TPA: redoxin family protein [candidate division Zixibacteria bacterium]|nr:redoxin family protein [candidate division Zixibacteria bacterium]